MNLRTQRKWCLTGTPVQNSLEDFFALTEYLGFYPVENPLNTRRWILEPLGARDEESIKNLRLLVTTIALRRSRDSERRRRRSEHMVKVILSPAERELYNSIRSKAKACLSPHDRFAFILKMRQVCSHGLWVRGQRPGNDATTREIDRGPNLCHIFLPPKLLPTLISKSSRAPLLCFECAGEQGSIANSDTKSTSLEESICDEPNTPVSATDIGMLDSFSESDVDMDRDYVMPAKSETYAKVQTVLGNLLELQQMRHPDTTPVKR